MLKKWLISGDFKLQKDETCKEYEIVKTDYLISECTFGLPIFKWDESNKIANDISKWITNSPEKTSLLFCYSLGKAQRLLNEISQTNFKGNICGHYHPKIYLKSNGDKLSFRCFAMDMNKNVLYLPAFGDLTGGYPCKKSFKKWAIVSEEEIIEIKS